MTCLSGSCQPCVCTTDGRATERWWQAQTHTHTHTHTSHTWPTLLYLVKPILQRPQFNWYSESVIHTRHPYGVIPSDIQTWRTRTPVIWPPFVCVCLNFNTVYYHFPLLLFPSISSQISSLSVRHEAVSPAGPERRGDEGKRGGKKNGNMMLGAVRNLLFFADIWIYTSHFPEWQST